MERNYKTQMEAARKGIVTPEMKIVAAKEYRTEEEIRNWVAEGKVAICANKNHKCIDPEGVGSMLKTKINVNLGVSRDCKDYDVEMQKVQAAIDLGADAIMDLSSHGNTIPFAASPDELRERVRMIVTDPARIKKTDKGHPEVCVAFKFQKLFNADEVEQIEKDCREGCIGCVACKKRLAEKMVDAMADMHVRRQEYQGKPEKIREILEEGAKKARVIAGKTMEEVREVMHLA